MVALQGAGSFEVRSVQYVWMFLSDCICICVCVCVCVCVCTSGQKQAPNWPASRRWGERLRRFSKRFPIGRFQLTGFCHRLGRTLAPTPSMTLATGPLAEDIAAGGRNGSRMVGSCLSQGCAGGFASQLRPDEALQRARIEALNQRRYPLIQHPAFLVPGEHPQLLLLLLPPYLRSMS